MSTSPRRIPRQRVPIDTQRFTAELESAYVAFGADASYAAAMARNAVTIQRKRSVWQARRDQKTILDEAGPTWQARRDIVLAEQVARELCEDAAPFRCTTISPCGTGDCKFAAGEMALLDIPDRRGPCQRPQTSNRHRYTTEAAVAALSAHRGSAR